MSNFILKALELKRKLDKLRPISPDREAKIMQKFRLDWNFHSNNLEGNSLTYGETKMLLMYGITAGGKPLKDSIEINGHNEAINLIEDVVHQNDPITENFIRQIHKLILKEPYQIDVKRSDGTWVKKTVKIGEYKTDQNHVETKTGEIFRFAEPFEVAPKMNDLINYYCKEIAKSDFNPIILAAKFHYDFIRIHPFDDGNGRTARILMNFILMQFGFPPAIIKTTDKENYFYALTQADVGEIEPFIEYIASNVVHSLEIMIKGAKGEEIEEADDLDKKIVLLETKLKSKANQEKIVQSKEAILEIFDDSITRFFKKFVDQCEKFERFYFETSFSLRIQSFGNASEVVKNKNEVLEKLRKFIEINEPRKIDWTFTYQEPKEKNPELDDLQKVLLSTFYSSVIINFSDESWKIEIHKQTLEKNYNQQISDEEITKILKVESERHLKTIEERIN